MTHVDIQQAKERFMELVEIAAAALRLGPVETQIRGRRFGSAKGLITMTEEFDDPLADFKDYM